MTSQPTINKVIMGFKIIILGISQTMTSKAVSHIPITDIKSCHHIPIIVIMIMAFTNHDVQCWTRLDRFSVAHIPIIDIKSCHHIPVIVIMITAFTNHDVFSKTIPTNKSSILKQLLLTLNNCCSLRTIAAH